METSAPGRDWWLKLQVTLGLAGGAVWFAGTLREMDFVAGIGCGLLLAAVVLRVGRKTVG